MNHGLPFLVRRKHLALPALMLPFILQAQDGSNPAALPQEHQATLQEMRVLPADEAPVITEQPKGVSVNAGQTATFKVAAKGVPEPTYQWLKNGTTIPEATTNTLSFLAQLNDHGAQFTVQITNSFGTIISDPAILAVTEAPVPKYKVTFLAGSNGSIKGNTTQEVPEGGSCTPVTATGNAGYPFAFWTGGQTPVDATEITLANVRKDMTITANFGGKAKIGQFGANVRGIDQNGAKVSLADYYGSITILDVSTQWCPPCNSEAPQYEAIYKQLLPKGIQCVTILTQNSNHGAATQTTLQQWVNKHGMTMRIMNDSLGTSKGPAQKYYVSSTGGFPTFAVLDKNFTVQYIGNDLNAAKNKALSLVK